MLWGQPILGGRLMPSRIQVLSCVIVLLCAPVMISAQVTHGKKPQLPPPYATKSAGNAPDKVSPPAGFLPTVPAGFKISIFATGFKRPRWLTVAPNGDIFLADMGAGEIVILRDPQNTGGAQTRENFVTGLTRPFGIAFHDDYVYVGEMKELVRFKYDPKTSKRLGEAEHLVNLPGGGHDTRSVAFSKDGKHLFIGVGSESNISPGEEPIRAAVTICDPDGKNARLFATGLRNPVGVGVEPVTGQVWVSVNERDELGDNLPPDYFTSVRDGGFYGWPYSYIGDSVDARVKPQRPDLVAKAIVPDVLMGAHVAALQFVFYTGTQFPESFRRRARILEPINTLGVSSRVRGLQGRATFGRSGAVHDRTCARSVVGHSVRTTGRGDCRAGRLALGIR